MAERAETGRLLSHLAHIDMRNHIRDIREQEGTLKDDGLSEAARLTKLLSSQREEVDVNVKVDQEFNLPYGFGFDYIIKEKADLMGDEKFENNKVMDQLVTKLGYMDYRDMLALNRYILDAKRQGDYHQKARAKTLTLAMSQMTRLRREQVDKQVAEAMAKERRTGAGASGDRDQKKLELVMNEDSLMAQVYQENYQDIKEAAEREGNDLRDLHKRFDYYYDKEKMADKLPTRWYNLEEIDEMDDVQYSTEFTDEADELLYKRYKMR